MINNNKQIILEVLFILFYVRRICNEIQLLKYKDLNELRFSDDSYSQEMSDLSFEARQCRLVNPILSNKQLIFKCHGEITKTQFSLQVEIQSLQKNIYVFIFFNGHSHNKKN